MAIGVNTSKWKPRQLRGTPAGRARDIVGLAVVSFALFVGIFYQYSNVTSKFRKALDCLYEDPIEEVERKRMIASGLANRSGDKIRELIKYNERPDLPDKYQNISHIVISKYFSSTPGMDESLSDFQEKKQSCTGPKKVSNAKFSSIKKRKQIKGQRDIRCLVKSKKNELVTYTKDFDQMCKSSGIDVDSEQLQLAIALSKSLQDTETQVDEKTVTVKPLSAVERSRKIKTTLQEYGFKVPTSVLKKPSKKLVGNKKYELLTKPDSKKQEIICRKYSEVLRLNHPAFNTCGVIENTDKEIYNKSTNIPYNKIKNVDVFYIGNRLIEKSSHTTSLLKDWSAIPGRPVSPDLKASNFKFYEFEFTQDELDCILSRPLQLAKEVINRKRYCDNESTQEIVKEDMNTQIDPISFHKNMDTTQRARSTSPDLFEDDEYSIEESTHKQLLQKSQNKTTTSTSDKMSFMDITECVSSVNYNEHNIVHSKICIVPEISKKPRSLCNEDEQLSIDIKGENAYDKKESVRQGSQINPIHTIIQSQIKLSSETIIEVNDFMEVTECVVSDFNQQNMQNDNTSDIEKQSGNLNVQLERSYTSLCENNHEDYSHHFIENIDLTQTMVENVNCLKAVNHLKERKEDYVCDIEKSRIEYNQEIESFSMDLTQSSNSNEDLPVVQISGKKSLDDTIIIYDNDISNNISVKDAAMNTHIPKEIIHCLSEDTSNDKISLSEDCLSASKIQTYEDSIDVVSDHGAKNSTSAIDNDDTIDLTQSPEISTQTYQSNESLGKQNNVSIDYDELYDMIAPTSESIAKDNDTIQSINKIDNDKNLSCESTKSLQKGLLPEMCSPEEITKKKNVGCTSIDQLSDKERLSNEGNICAVSLSDSNLPNIEVKNIFKNILLGKNCDLQSTPSKLSDLSNKSIDHTPANSDYVIKTDNVTPILDYESMTTPARNKELEKYGLKPFKRKRAIQLLTYLYNQTHPVVEECALDDRPSTSKKPKVDKQETKIFTTHTAHKHQKEATFEDQDLNKENLYKETKEHPDIKDIECCPEDWVFQTREKSKVHSCRVPLHIVFHNYVSCRSMLRAAILRYEPINIDVIHKDLVGIGFRYNPKELLKFMDKKCITVRTAENKTRNQKI